MNNDLNISACIITNNDIRILNAIKSVMNTCNEIIVVETSGSNSFINELEKLNVKLFYYNWDNNFSDARNFAISKAKGKWILNIDSDEILKSDIKQLPDKYDMYYVNMNINGTYSGAGRIFKNNGKIKYVNGVHETAEYSVTDDKRCMTNTVIEHCGYTDEETVMKRKLIRNFKILLRDKNNRMRSYYLAMTYSHFGKHNKAIKTGHIALTENISNESKARISIMLFDSFFALGEIKLYYLFKSLNYLSKQITARLKLYEHLQDSQMKLKQLYEMVNILYKGKTDLQNDSFISTEFLKQQIKKLQLCQ